MTRTFEPATFSPRTFRPRTFGGVAGLTEERVVFFRASQVYQVYSVADQVSVQDVPAQQVWQVHPAISQVE